MVVDGDEDVAPANVASALRAVAGDAVADLIEAAELLKVDVEQFARRFALVSLDVLLRRQVGQLRHPGSPTNTTARGFGARVRGDARLQEQLASQLDERCRDARINGSWR